MTIRYFFARLKKSIFLTAAGAAALGLIIIILIISAATPPILNQALVSHSRQLSGDADLMLSNAPDTADRFFELSTLRGDQVLKSNSTYIYGYFKTYVQAGIGGYNEYCTLFAADYKNQNEYNPIKSDNLAQDIDDTQIIISKSFAVAAGVTKGNRITVQFGGKSAVFEVVCVADNEGIFFSPNALFISSKALSRLIPGMGSTIITHCFIKANDAASLDIIKTRLNTEYGRLNAVSASDTTQITNFVNSVMIPIVSVSVIASVFCIIALFVLLRLIFAPARENFELMRMLGASELRIAKIAALFGLFMLAAALLIVFPAICGALGVMRGSSFLLSGTSISSAALFFGILSGLVLSILCAVTAVRSVGEKQKKTNPLKAIKYIFDWRIILSISAVFAVVTAIIINTLPYIGLVFAVLSLAGFLSAIPKAAAFLYGRLHQKARNIYSVRLKTLSQSVLFQRFGVFAAVCVLVLITVISSVIDMHETINRESHYPFDIVVTDIKKPDEPLYQNAAGAEGVFTAVKGGLFFNAHIECGASLYCNLFALEQDGFTLFGANFSAAQGGGAVIGGAFAAENSLGRGDMFTFTHGGRQISFTVSDIVKSNYLGGKFILVDLAQVASAERPYYDILVVSDGNIDTAVNSINASVGGVSVISINALANFLTEWYKDFIWLADVFCAAVGMLAAVTAVIMIFIRRISTNQEPQKLRILGLTPRRDAKQNLFAVLMSLLPLFIFTPLLMFLICKISYPVYFLFAIRKQMPYYFNYICIISILFFAFTALAETIICRLISKKDCL